MNVTPTAIADVLVIEPRVHGDHRGYFMETWRKSEMESLGIFEEFVQDNQSKSLQNTLRGLHYQLKHPQGKLVRVLAGEIFDVVVDLRKSSKSFGHWVGEILSAENHKQLWVPGGFAHGFYVLSDSAEIAYKCTQYYDAEDDRSLLWNDPDLAIDWPLLNNQPLLSEKDRTASPLSKVALYQ
ncbi:MAG: dTDP-4-dehydrorhamnose 3,5-epimerase [Proteobacteria bacterium]|nr:dTDP-4-dehydrorhamnose 3,5-epimerase [Pseudomonadota bacterium]